MVAEVMWNMRETVVGEGGGLGRISLGTKTAVTFAIGNF